VIDPVADYQALMASLFDFAAIRALFASGFTMRFDAMHAVTGPYATAILEGELGAPKGTVVNGTPLPDFGGHHPDPNLVHAKELYDLMMSPEAPGCETGSGGMMKRGARLSGPPAPAVISLPVASSDARAQPLPEAVRTSTQSPFRERTETDSLAA